MVYIYRHTWTDHKTNTETAKEQSTSPVLDKIQCYVRLGWVRTCKQNAS